MKSVGVEDPCESRFKGDTNGVPRLTRVSETFNRVSGVSSNLAVPGADAAPGVPADHGNGDSLARPLRTAMSLC